MTINVPCRVCDTRIDVENLDRALCGPACEALHSSREAADKSNAQPGDYNYHPTNSTQNAAHRAALRRKQWA